MTCTPSDYRQSEETLKIIYGNNKRYLKIESLAEYWRLMSSLDIMTLRTTTNNKTSFLIFSSKPVPHNGE